MAQRPAGQSNTRQYDRQRDDYLGWTNAPGGNTIFNNAGVIDLTLIHDRYLLDKRAATPITLYDLDRRPDDYLGRWDGIPY